MRKGRRVCLVCLAIFCLAACGPKSNSEQLSTTLTLTEGIEATVTPSAMVEPITTPTESPDILVSSDLSEDEIRFFNEEFFAVDTKYPGRRVRNNILYSEFDNPAQIDIQAMLYDEHGEEDISEEEYAYLRNRVEELFDTSKFTTTYINGLLRIYLGISLEESDKKGLDGFIYYAEADAYYLVRSDSMGISVRVKSGTRHEDGTISLIYLRSSRPFSNITEEEMETLPTYQVVLKKTVEGYQFLSNKIIVQ